MLHVRLFPSMTLMFQKYQTTFILFAISLVSVDRVKTPFTIAIGNDVCTYLESKLCITPHYTAQSAIECNFVKNSHRYTHFCCCGYFLVLRATCSFCASTFFLVSSVTIRPGTSITRRFGLSGLPHLPTPGQIRVRKSWLHHGSQDAIVTRGGAKSNRVMKKTHV